MITYKYIQCRLHIYILQYRIVDLYELVIELKVRIE